MGSCGARDVQCGGAVRAWGSQGQQHARSSPPHPIAHSTALTSTRITCKQSRAHACADGAPPRVRAFSCCLGASPLASNRPQHKIAHADIPWRPGTATRASSRASPLKRTAAPTSAQPLCPQASSTCTDLSLKLEHWQPIELEHFGNPCQRPHTHASPYQRAAPCDSRRAQHRC